MTKKKKTAILILSLALVGALLIGGTLAYFTDRDEAQNVFTLGKVDGNLDEPIWNDNNPGGEIENVQPGDTIDKDPTLTMAKDSEEAYARFQVTYEDITAEQFAELKFLKGEGENAVEVTFDEEGYFYVQGSLKATDVYTLFDKVVIPSTWGNEMAGKTFKINVVAELVQVKNFDGNLEKDNDGNIIGWGDVEIKALEASE